LYSEGESPGELIMKMKSSLLFFALMVFPQISLADDAANEEALKKAWDAVNKVSTVGPTDIALVDQATLHLPGNMIFIPKTEANALLVAWGNSAGDRLLGMIMPNGSQDNWVATIDKTLEGYVKDDEAKDWDAAALLQNLKDGTEAQNEDRKARGFEPLEVTGWIEKPNYEAASHRLVWSMKMIHKGVVNDENAIVNYNTYALGRDGYLEVDLLTNEKSVEHDKPFAKQVLAALEYKSGKRYEDYKPGTDHLAEYGIAALIGGVAAKKLGLLALASVFILKFVKIFAVAAIVGLGAIKRFFFRGKKSDSQ
jgi:uncharacterized membrane-anchored protein